MPFLSQRLNITGIEDDPNDAFLADSKVRELLWAIQREGDSMKIIKACEKARDLQRNGEKCVIWSFFRGTVETIANRLRTTNNASYRFPGT